MKKIYLVSLLVLSLLLSACSVTFGGADVVRGSGKMVSESRPVSGFTSLELAGSADVEVSFGETESVVVEAEDNILPLVETEVRGSTLVVRLKPLTSISTTRGIHVTVTMKELESASLPGSGQIVIENLQAEQVGFGLYGSGKIIADGAVDELVATLSGSGNIECGDLQADSVSVKISGSGNAEVYASESLDASISGSGNIKYNGDPEEVNKSVSGSGEVQASR
jgi:hypothetical protein